MDCFGLRSMSYGGQVVATPLAMTKVRPCPLIDLAALLRNMKAKMHDGIFVLCAIANDAEIPAAITPQFALPRTGRNNIGDPARRSQTARPAQSIPLAPDYAKDLLINNLVTFSSAFGSERWCNSILRESHEETSSRWRVSHRRL